MTQRTPFNSAPAIYLLLTLASLALSVYGSRTPAPARPGDVVTLDLILETTGGRRLVERTVTTPLRSPELIEGVWASAVGMRPGERLEVVLPPGRAYGERGRAPIPPNATLVARLHLLQINERSRASTPMRAE